VTITDEHGYAIGHGCARPEPQNHTRTTRHPGPDPPGGYGVWRLAAGVPGRPVLLITLDPVALDECDHRFEARGHDPASSSATNRTGSR
jgi:hypothetical protein